MVSQPSYSIRKKKTLSSFMLVILFVGIILNVNLTVKSINQESDESSFRVLMVMDDGYGGNCHYIKEIFENYGWHITTTATKKIITGACATSFLPLTVDITLSELDSYYLYDCITFLPGSKHDNLLNNSDIHELIQNAISKNIIVTGWCRAVRILCWAGVLDGKNITGHPDYQTEYEAAGATYNYQAPPILDGNIITSSRSRFYRNETCDLIKTTIENNNPELVEFSSYLGGSGDERGTAANLNYLGDVEVDSEGNIIIVGRSASVDFPTKNAYQNECNGFIDITISKFYPNGTLCFSTYFGGSGNEWATGVEIDSDDNIVFAGITGSADFPTNNSYDDTHNGGSEGNADCYVTKLSKDGQSIIFSTFFGGTNSDWCYAMGIDANDRIVITGTTYSYNLPLLDPYQDSHAGSLDAYVTVFEADGQSLVYSSYLGTSGIDHGRGADFDSEGNLYVTGQIGGEGLGTDKAFQSEYAGGAMDGYLAKFTNEGTLECFSYLGGSGMDRGNDLLVDSNDKIVITGYTLSDDFPIHKAYQEELTKCDSFITKFDESCKKVVFSTFIGGSSYDYGNAIALDINDNIIITGHTTSEDYPITTAIYPLLTEIKYNVHLTKFSNDGSKLLFSTAFGGEQEEFTVGVASDQNNNMIMIGFTQSENYSIYHAIQGKYAGNYDLFILKIHSEGFLEINRKPLIISLSVVGTSGFVIATTVLIVIHKKRK